MKKPTKISPARARFMAVHGNEDEQKQAALAMAAHAKARTEGPAADEKAEQPAREPRALSPARSHFVHQASKASQVEEDKRSPENATEYELALAKLYEDRRRLKGIQSVEGKAELKRKLLPEYLPWIAGAIEGDSGAQDAVLMTCMVWFLDIGEFPSALEIGRYALKHDLVMPDQYQRTTATVLAEELADQTLKALAVEGAPTDLESLLACLELVADHDMPDPVRAKLHKAAGLILRASENPEDKAEALTHLQRAFQLDERAGVKKDIEVLTREVAKGEKDNDKKS